MPSLLLMWRATAVVGVWTLASRLLGFARDILIAALLGAGPVADAFLVALKLPNLFRRLFGEGAFNAAFVPAITRLDQPAGRRLAGELAVIIGVVLGCIVLAGEIAMPWLMRGFAPGFLATPARFALAIMLTRITFPYLLLICLAALLSGVLNSAHRFAVAAATPVLFNIICIAALLGLRHLLPTAGHALAVGVAVAGVAQLAWLTAACARANLLPIATWKLSPAGRLVLRRMVPGLLGAGVTQLNLTVGVIIASLLPPGTIAVLYYADRVNQLPLGMIGAALGTTLLPALSSDLAQGERRRRRRTPQPRHRARTHPDPAGKRSPAAAGAPHHGGAVRTRRIRATGGNSQRGRLAGVCRRAAFYVLARLFAPAWFARGDTTTPVVVGSAAVALNLGLGLALMGRLGFLAPAVGASAAGVFNAGLSGLLLHRRGAWRPDALLAKRLPRILAACAVMAAALIGLEHLLGRIVGDRGPPGWLGLAILIGAGLALFAGAAQVLGAFDLRRLRAGLRAGTTTL